VLSTDSRHRLHKTFLYVLTIGAFVLTSAVFLSGRQNPATPPHPKLVRLNQADAVRLAKEARAEVTVDVPPGLELTLWAPEQLVVDPVAIDLDPQGIVYVTSSTRNNMPLDIRGHPTWFTPAHMLKTTEDLLEFYRKEISPERSATTTWLEDYNKDGSRDWRDLAEYKDRIHRIRDTDGDGLADESRILIENFNADPSYDIAGGLLYHEGDLIVGVAPGVYRLRDENGDGEIDRQIPISEGYNIHPAFGGHGISGVIMGPDGRLYWEVGDMGFNVVDKTGKRWPYPNQGGVLRSNPDGTDFEVFATGIRNLQEFSFDEHGNLISVDNDGDHQGEFERLVYIPNGSDSGWRSNWQYGKYTDPRNNRYNVWMDEQMFKPRFEGQAAHIIPPVAPWHAGPSGMVYNPGTALSEEWRKHFMVSSFPGAPSNARIYAFTLKEEGAGFALDNEKVLLRGILTVGMKIGPDGALYLTDWVTGWDSKNSGRLWKLDAPKVAGTPIRKEVQSLLAADFESRGVTDLSNLLRHVDMRVRQKSQFELVRRGDAQTLLAAVRDRADQLARIHGLWGLAQLARKDAQHASHFAAFLKDDDPEIRAQAAKMLGDVRHSGSAAALLPLLKDSAPRARFFAAEALGRLGHKPAIGSIVEMLADNNDRDLYLRHAGSLALSRIGDANAITALAQHPSRGVRMAAVVALRRLRHPDIAKLLTDADEGIVTQAARAINDDGSIDAAVPALAQILGERRFTTEPILRRALNANLRVGTNEALTRVAAFAADTARSEAMRAEAINVLGVWIEPSPLDRVDGMYIGQPWGTRDTAAARAAVERLFALAKGDATPAIKIALADAAGKLGVTAVTPVLLAQARSDPSPQVRLAALRALQAVKAPNMDSVMRTALSDSDPSVRRAALNILPALPLSDAAKVQHLDAVIKSASIPEQQGAFEVLGTLKTTAAYQLLGRYVDQLVAGKLPPELQIDLVDAVQSGESQSLHARLESYQKAREAETLLDAFRPALLRGGQPLRGREVYTDNAAAGCPRCHSLGGRGADVGPNLTNIGSTLQREQILQALLEPNARIAPGFGMVSMKLKNGQQVDGTLREDTDTHVVIVAGTPPVEQRIARTDIASRTDPVSAMPPVGQLLKPKEIRDLVEFLSRLK
jgi:putative membrane-bound dehydrogenase-like protein